MSKVALFWQGIPRRWLAGFRKSALNKIRLARFPPAHTSKANAAQATGWQAPTDRFSLAPSTCAAAGAVLLRRAALSPAPCLLAGAISKIIKKNA
jgi:hypothetical protein